MRRSLKVPDQVNEVGDKLLKRCFKAVGGYEVSKTDTKLLSETYGKQKKMWFKKK